MEAWKSRLRVKEARTSPKIALRGLNARLSPDHLKPRGHIKGDPEPRLVIEKKTKEMKFGKLLACAPILAFSSGLKIESQGYHVKKGNGLIEYSFKLREDLEDYVNDLDPKNQLGLRGAVDKCTANPS